MLAIIGILGISLAIGSFMLVWKNRQVIFAGATTGNWIEIKERVSPGGNSAAGGQGKENKTAKAAPPDLSASAANLAKKENIPVKWCALNGASAKTSAVIISEVAWMGSPASYSDEWIELKNIYRGTVDLAGWQLQNKSQSIKISFREGSLVAGGGFYLLERTDDNSAPSVAADAIYKGSLANSSEILYLFDDNCQLHDFVRGASKWPAGDNVSKRTMERRSDLSWKTSALSGGTPKQENY